MRRVPLSAPVFLCALLLWMGLGWAQEYSFGYTCDNQGLVIHPDSVGVFVTLLANTGAQADTYRVVLDRDLPGAWQSLACLPYGCFYDSANVPVASAQVETITVDIMPLGSPGAGTVTMRVRSLADPSQRVAIPLTAITDTGVEILVVDDDGTEDYEIYYQAALDSTGRTHGTLHNATTTIGADELDPFQAVVWFTGEATPVLTEEDRGAISAYLEGGGRLFISGQDIAYALCDTASGEADMYTRSWFHETFLSLYIGDNSDTLVLEGLPEDPISQDLTLYVSGGDGADNQSSPDIIAPDLWDWDPYVDEIFIYPPDEDLHFGGVRVNHWMASNPNIVYFSFGFEAINYGADRALVMERILDWLMSPTAVEDSAEMASFPKNFFLSPSYPNPFNATTFMILTIPGQEPVPVALKIFNILGQEVRTVLEETVAPGSRVVVWDGKDERGRELASGVYFSRLQVGNFAQTRKLVLTR